MSTGPRLRASSLRSRNSRATRRDERSEQPLACSVLVHKVLRVELDREQPGPAGGFDGFDGVILRPCDSHEAFAEHLHSLMMMAIDLHIRSGEDLCQLGAGRDAELVVHLVAWPVRSVSIEMLDERAAQRHVQDLLSATDAKGRQVLFNRPTCCEQLEPVERWVRRLRAIDRLTVLGRVDVPAAR